MLAACSVFIPEEKPDELIKQEERRHFIKNLAASAAGAYKVKDWAVAQQQYEMLLEKDPENEVALYRLGNLAYRSNRIGDAANYYETLLKINPNHSLSHHNLAICRLIQAKKHLKLYAAMMDPALDQSSIEKVLSEIKSFANNQSAYQKKKK